MPPRSLTEMACGGPSTGRLPAVSKICAPWRRVSHRRPMAIFVAALDQPPSVLLAVSADSGLDAGKLLKAAVTEAGGRGGGNQRMAQGSVPHRESLEQALERLKTF